MRGERGPGVKVEILADHSRLSLVSGSGLIGDWEVGSFGIKSLHEGFAIWAEEESSCSRPTTTFGLARELGLQTASPRMARRVAASRRRKDLPRPDPIPEPPRSYVAAAIAVAPGGVLVLAGSLLLRADPALGDRSAEVGLGVAGNFWSAFGAGGLLMVAAALALSVRARVARGMAVLSVMALVIVFGNAAQHSSPQAHLLIACGFIAGGIVIGVDRLVRGFARGGLAVCRSVTSGGCRSCPTSSYTSRHWSHAYSAR